MKDYKPRCCDCGTKFDLLWGPDPYQEEINLASDPVWLCGACWQESASDI